MALHAAEHSTDGDMGLADSRRLPQWPTLNAAENLFAPLAKALARRRVQRPAARGAGRHQRPPLRVRPSHVRPGRPARQGICPHAAAAVGALQMSISSRSTFGTSSPITRSALCCPSCSTSTSWPAKRPARRIPATPQSMSLASTVYIGPPAKSADAVAAALADGIDPEVVGEAISLASNMLCLRQGAGSVADPRRFGRRSLVRRDERLPQHGPQSPIPSTPSAA